MINVLQQVEEPAESQLSTLAFVKRNALFLLLACHFSENSTAKGTPKHTCFIKLSNDHTKHQSASRTAETDPV